MKSLHKLKALGWIDEQRRRNTFKQICILFKSAIFFDVFFLILSLFGLPDKHIGSNLM